VVATTAHEAVTATQLNGLNTTTDGINTLLSNQTTDNNLNSQVPKAYINYLFFDEQFKCTGSGFSKVGSNGVIKDHHNDLTNLSAPKNGYVYIYASNESPVNVFFDNVQVVHTRGAILEETHYYPFGLTMAGISSKAAGGLQNRYKFNDGTELESGEFSDGSGLDLYATDYRSYDPQIGRFHQLDPLADEDNDWSPFVFAYNNPILINDPLGLQGDSTQPAPTPLPAGFAPNPVTNPNAPKGSEANPIPTGVDVVVSSTTKNVSTTIQPVNQPTIQYSPIVVTPSSNPKQGWGSTAQMLQAVVITTGTRLNPAVGFATLGAGFGVALWYAWNNPSSSQSQLYFASPDNTSHAPFILESRGKGERNQTARPDGTDNPFKKLKPDPKKPGNVLEKNSHTGKTVSKPAPPGFFEWWNSK
jgi:RHS repeat-associated protein